MDVRWVPARSAGLGPGRVGTSWPVYKACFERSTRAVGGEGVIAEIGWGGE